MTQATVLRKKKHFDPIGQLKLKKAKPKKQVSKTVPEMATKITDAVKRAARGEKISRMIGYYETELGVKIPDVDRLSKTERADLLKVIKSNYEKLRENMLKEMKEQEKNDMIAKAREQAQKELAEMQKKQQQAE